MTLAQSPCRTRLVARLGALRGWRAKAGSRQRALAMSVAMWTSVWGATALHGQGGDGAGAWHLFGSSLTSVDSYEVGGDKSASPYQFEGTFWSSLLDLNLELESARGRSFLLGVELLGAEDDYGALTPA